MSAVNKAKRSCEAWKKPDDAVGEVPGRWTALLTPVLQRKAPS